MESYYIGVNALCRVRVHRNLPRTVAALALLERQAPAPSNQAGERNHPLLRDGVRSVTALGDSALEGDQARAIRGSLDKDIQAADNAVKLRAGLERGIAAFASRLPAAEETANSVATALASNQLRAARERLTEVSEAAVENASALVRKADTAWKAAEPLLGTDPVARTGAARQLAPWVVSVALTVVLLKYMLRLWGDKLLAVSVLTAAVAVFLYIRLERVGKQRRRAPRACTPVKQWIENSMAKHVALYEAAAATAAVTAIDARIASEQDVNAALERELARAPEGLLEEKNPAHVELHGQELARAYARQYSISIERGDTVEMLAERIGPIRLHDVYACLSAPQRASLMRHLGALGETARGFVQFKRQIRFEPQLTTQYLTVGLPAGPEDPLAADVRVLWPNAQIVPAFLGDSIEVYYQARNLSCDQLNSFTRTREAYEQTTADERALFHIDRRLRGLTTASTSRVLSMRKETSGD